MYWLSGQTGHKLLLKFEILAHFKVDSHSSRLPLTIQMANVSDLCTMLHAFMPITFTSIRSTTLVTVNAIK